MSNLYYDILIANKMKSRRLAAQNTLTKDDGNEFIRAGEEQYKQILGELKENLWTYKSGKYFMITSLLVMVISPVVLFLRLYWEGEWDYSFDFAVLLIFFCMALFPALSIPCAGALKRGGPLGIIDNLKNEKIRLDDEELVYSYDTLDGNYTEDFMFRYHMVKVMKYKDIKRITFNKATRRYKSRPLLFQSGQYNF